MKLARQQQSVNRFTNRLSSRLFDNFNAGTMLFDDEVEVDCSTGASAACFRRRTSLRIAR
jgi:hypothetical protein